MNMTKMNRAYVYASIFVTGAAALAIEILGTRALAPFYGSTIYVWSSLIIVTLGALALGYYLGGRIGDRHPSAASLYAVIAAGGILTSLPMKVDQWVLPLSDRLGIEWGSLAAALALFAAPLALIGMASPIAIRMLSSSTERSGSVSGTVFAVGTVGSICGAILSGFALLPYHSVTFLLSACALALILVSIAGHLIFQKGRSIAPIAGLVILAGISYLSPKYHYDDTYTFSLEYEAQSRYADLKVMTVGGSRCLAANGFTQSCTSLSGEPAFDHILTIGEMAKEAREGKDVFKALILGIGAGDALRYMPQDLDLDAVDIDPVAVSMARDYFGLSENPRQRIVIDDARRFLRKSGALYDMIIYDAYLGGSIPQHLITREAMDLYASHLKQTGFMLMNVGGRPDPEDAYLASIVKTAKSAFAHVDIEPAIPEDPALLQSVVLYMSNGDELNSLISGHKNKVDMALTNGQVVRDGYSPMELAAADTFRRFRERMITFGGYKMMFAL